MEKNLKQYRTLFENWQRHLVEDEVEDTAKKAVAQNIPTGAGVPGDELEQAEEDVEAELRAVNDFENKELPGIVNNIKNVFGVEKNDQVSRVDVEEEPPSIEEQKKRLFKIIKEELAKKGILIEATTNRGGIEGQMAVVDWLYANEKVDDEHVAISNTKGSGLPDVTVVKKKIEINTQDKMLNKALAKGNRKKHFTVTQQENGTRTVIINKETKLRGPLDYILNTHPTAVKARIEVKSSNSLKDLGDTGYKVETAFFDQTVGTSQVGTQKDEAYFEEALKEMAKINNIVFKKSNGDASFEPAAKYLERLKGGEVFKAIMNLGHIEDIKGNKVRCGRWGELIAPDANKSPDSYQELEGVDGVFTAQQPVYLEGSSAVGSKGDDQWGFADLNNVVKKNQLFFYKEVEVQSKFKDYGGTVRKKSTKKKRSYIKYYFKITGKAVGEYKVGKTAMVYVIGKDKKGDYRTPGGKSRQGADSGALKPGCFSFEIKQDEVEDLISRTSQTSAGTVGGISASGAAEGAVVDGVKKHWKANNDSYFAIAAKSNKDVKDYEKIFMYKTGDLDPLTLGTSAATFDTSDTSRMFFATYGLADIGQVRAKVGADIIAKGDAENILSIPPKESK